MENKIDAVFTTAQRDQALDLIRQARQLLPFTADLSPEIRTELIKMGDKSRAFVEDTLTLGETDDSFLPRSFDVKEMRQDKDLHDNLSPVAIELLRFHEAVEDTVMLVGSDLMMNALEIYANARKNGTGEHLDRLAPMLARRFARRAKKETEQKKTEEKTDGTEDEQS